MIIEIVEAPDQKTGETTPETVEERIVKTDLRNANKGKRRS
jgi:uncharacterized protein YwbE